MRMMAHASYRALLARTTSAAARTQGNGVQSWRRMGQRSAGVLSRGDGSRTGNGNGYGVQAAWPLRQQQHAWRGMHTSGKHVCCAQHDGDGAAHPSAVEGEDTDAVLPLEQVLSHIELMESWSCTGCGIELQHDAPKKVGYLPTPLLAKLHDIRELKKLRCERCFQITHYGKIPDAKLPYHEYEKRVRELKAKDMLMVQLVDILDITGSLLPKARHLFGNKDVLLVVNKGDLVPEKSGMRRLMRRIQTQAKEAGIANIRAVYLVSAMKGIGMKEIIEDIKKYRKGRDICVVGAANVGKSTFLNSMMQHLVDRKWQHNHRKYMKLHEVASDDLSDPESLALLNLDDESGEGKQKAASIAHAPVDVFLHEGEDLEEYDQADEEDRAMTTSPLPGTTLAVQHLPIVANNELFNILDTPGLIVDAQRQKLIEVLALDGANKLRDVFPTKNLPMTTYRVGSGRCLFLGALLRIDFDVFSIAQPDATTEGNEKRKNKSTVLLSWHGVLPGHLSKSNNADETFIKHAGGLLAPPRGLDALSFTGPLQPALEIHLKDYITKEIQTKSKNAKKPKRTSAVELEVPGFGWLTVTALDLDGTHAAEQTLREGTITVSTCRGISVVPRMPLFPFEMSTSKSSTWKS